MVAAQARLVKKGNNTLVVEQLWDAQAYATEGGFVPALGLPVMEWLAPAAGERILDLGCGDGTLSLRLMAAGATVVGVDSAPAMVRAALAKGVDARLGDAEHLGEILPGEHYDAVFSNAALHWVRDQDAMLRGVAALLLPGGRFVFEMGGHGNIAAVRTALRAAVQTIAPGQAQPLLAGEDGENYFPTAAAYRSRLIRHGFKVGRLELLARPTVLGAGGIRGWYRTFRNGVLGRLTNAEQEQVLECAEQLLEPVLRDAEGVWMADYVRLRATAILQPREERT